MFETFYHLSGSPFSLTPDARFFFGSSGHNRAMSHLVYGLSQQDGFIVITGDVGAGKTTLVEQIWSQLDRSRFVIARIATTQLSADDLLRLVMANFGLPEAPNTEKFLLLRQFQRMVGELHVKGQRCLLVLDEAQNLSLPAMESLRMLSNMTVDGRASLQTILLGQPQFRWMLGSKNWEQLRQRVLASYHLGPLAETETRGYIEHRLRLVDWRDDPAWDDDAFGAAHRATSGIPRRINTLCARVLLRGTLEETHRITAAMVEQTAAEYGRDLGAGDEAPKPPADIDAGTLLQRIEALEQQLARQEKVFKRVLSLLEAQMVNRS